MFEKLTNLAGNYPKIVITFTILVTVFFYFGLSKLDMVGDMEEVLPDDLPAKIIFDEVDATFGGAKYAMIVMDMGNVFTSASLHKIERLTLDLEKIKGVNSVISITNVEEIRGIEDGIEVVELIEEIPDSESALLELKNRVLSDDDYAGQIVSENGKIALIMVQLLPNQDDDTIIGDIKDIVHKLGLDNNTHLTGEPIMDKEVDNLIAGDMAKLLPIVILVMIAILYLSFRSIRGVVLPLSIVIVTVIWTMGLMGYLGMALTPISNIMPVILISMGIADGIHILTRYRDELEVILDKRKALNAAIVSVGLACFITSVTTIAGFGSLYSSSLTIIKDFGLATAIGVGIAFIITVTFFLALLFLLSPNKIKPDMKRKFMLKNILEKWADLLITKRKTVLVTSGLLLLLVGAGIPLISVESDFINFFKPDSPVRVGFEIVKENFGGAGIIQIVVKGDIQDPKVLQAMEKLQNDIEKNDILSRPTSIVNLLRKTNKALHEGKAEYEMLPETEEEAAQYLLLLSMGGSDQLDNMISFDYEQAIIQSRLSTNNNSARGKMIIEVEKAIRKYFTSDIEVVLTGQPILSHNMDRLIITGQLQSLALAILFIFLLMVIISHSFIYGAICTIPIMLTVILNFGIMGWFKIPLDVASAVIASIVIGIGIDYAIHFFYRYREELAVGNSVEEALKITISNTGQAILYNAAAVGIGFLVLVFATMPPMQRFGWLIALTMLFSSVASMTVLPALLLLQDKRKSNKQNSNIKY